MSDRDDWYRSAEWNDAIEASFRARLKRARRKEQYLRIQASCLAKRYPHIALRLLDEYFAMPDKFDNAIAYNHRAEALLSLGRRDEALEAYEAALRREAEFPSSRTQTYVTYPYLVAVNQIKARYARALEVLEARKGELMFPVDRFMWHAARSLIFSEQGERASARQEALAATAAAATEHSGFRNHPTIGLVGDRHEKTLERLRGCIDA